MYRSICTNCGVIYHYNYLPDSFHMLIGREIGNISCYGCLAKRKITFPDKEFFDYEAKYEGASQEITPARLDNKTREKVEKIAKHAYKSLGMSGFSRSEYIIMNGTPYMLEMNTNPGFSPASILPQQAKIY